jgi:hypothetical protein
MTTISLVLLALDAGNSPKPPESMVQLALDITDSPESMMQVALDEAEWPQLPHAL